MTVERELEWWTGKYDERFKQPLGEASRHGFVVIAPLWSRLKQSDYEYTENEHHRVLASLRDAFRKVSIDTDRVFISGHQSGGTAAWDIAVSHPDIWAGLVCISGNSSGFTKQYKNNARYFPIYYVGGDMEGPESPLVRNGEILDDYVRLHPDCMVTMYRGRGKDHFQEELPRIIEWMKLANHVRSNAPADIKLPNTLVSKQPE
jgi:pimeloyl-ACP methyl ester carboxylesterase